MKDAVFTERQSLQFKGMWFVYLLFFAVLCLFAFGTVQQVILHRQFGDKPAPDWLLIACSIFMMAMIISFFVARLETRITSETILYRWYPFKAKFTVVDWSDVEKADVFDFGFVGAGYRYTPYGTVHTGGSTIGLRLYMRSGKTLILGTKKVEELRRFIENRQTA